MIDITTHCNAKCPQCSRIDSWSGGLNKVKELPLVHWTLPEIQQCYTTEQLKGVEFIHMSPTWGDPMMNPDIYDITDHILESLPRNSTLSISTNGSMRDEDFWWKFGYLAIKHSSKFFRVVFCIDGIDQDMHSKYRRNTNLQKVLNNMLSFSDNGRSIVHSQSIIFKHNQDYIKEIGELSKQYGSNQHTLIKSNRFIMDDEGNYKEWHFLNEHGKQESFEWADKEFENAFMGHYNNKKTVDKEILCKWAFDNVLNINFTGQVWPCCYIGCKEINEDEKYNKTELAQQYNLMALESNIKFTPLQEIIKNKWFDGYLQESIENNPVNACVKHCSTQIRSFEKQQVRSVIKNA